MNLSEIQAKGIAKFLTAPGLAPDKIKMHITQVEPGTRSHDAHTHAGTEVFYMLEGNATIEVEDERYPLNQNEVAVIDASRPHGIFNRGATRMRYIVIVAQ
ncbi:MAG: cupin domain-containing protein [Chloroflexota bacterium]